MNAAAVALNGRLRACDLIKDGVLVKVPANTNITQLTTDTSLFFTKAEFYGISAVTAGVGTDNTSDVLLGIQDTNGNFYMLRTVSAGGEGLELRARTGTKYRLSDLYIKTGTNGDGVVVFYDGLEVE